MLFFPLINVKVPTIVGILTFMSRKDFINVKVPTINEQEKFLWSVELSMKKDFGTSEPDLLFDNVLYTLDKISYKTWKTSNSLFHNFYIFTYLDSRNF